MEFAEMRSRIGGRPAALAVAVLLAAVITTGSEADAQVGPSMGSSQVNPNSYSLTAEADAFETTVVDKALPLITTASASPIGASATIDALGQSLADAGAPYSPLAFSLPPLVNGLTGGSQAPSLPPLPGYVSSTYPENPSNCHTQAGYALCAKTGETSSSGEAEMGATQPGTTRGQIFASANATANSDGSVTVSGSTGIDLLNFGALFDIGNVSSTAEIDEQASQHPVITTNTKLGTITLLNIPTGVSGGAFSLLGVGSAIPLSTAVLPALNALLAPGGISLTYLPATYTYTDGSTTTGTPDNSRTIQGLDSGGLQITETKNLPSQGDVTTQFTLGRVHLLATDSAGAPPGGLAPGGSGSGLDSASPDTTAMSSISPSDSFGAPGGASSVTAVTEGAPTASSPTIAVAPGGSGQSVVTPTRPGSPARSSLSADRAASGGPSGESSYLILIVAALAALGGSQLIRLLGVRLAFTSQPISQR